MLLPSLRKMVRPFVANDDSCRIIAARRSPHFSQTFSANHVLLDAGIPASPANCTPKSTVQAAPDLSLFGGVTADAGSKVRPVRLGEMIRWPTMKHLSWLRARFRRDDDPLAAENYLNNDIPRRCDLEGN